MVIAIASSLALFVLFVGEAVASASKPPLPQRLVLLINGYGISVIMLSCSGPMRTITTTLFRNLQFTSLRITILAAWQ